MGFQINCKQRINDKPFDYEEWAGEFCSFECQEAFDAKREYSRPSDEKAKLRYAGRARYSARDYPL